MSDTTTTQPPDADKGSPLTGKGIVDATAPLPELSPDRSPGEPITGLGRGVKPPPMPATGKETQP